MTNSLIYTNKSIMRNMMKRLLFHLLGFDTCSYLITALKYANEKDIPLTEALKSVKDVKLLLGDNRFEILMMFSL